MVGVVAEFVLGSFASRAVPRGRLFVFIPTPPIIFFMIFRRYFYRRNTKPPKAVTKKIPEALYQKIHRAMPVVCIENRWGMVQKDLSFLSPKIASVLRA